LATPNWNIGLTITTPNPNKGAEGILHLNGPLEDFFILVVAIGCFLSKGKNLNNDFNVFEHMHTKMG